MKPRKIETRETPSAVGCSSTSKASSSGPWPLGQHVQATAIAATRTDPTAGNAPALPAPGAQVEPRNEGRICPGQHDRTGPERTARSLEESRLPAALQ